jgi:very-short-patch-repair endonuclease
MRTRHSLISTTVAAQRLKRYAAENRAAPTESEARLWSALSGGKLGVSFRRQVVLDNHLIGDFLAPRARLVVEVDGGYHGGRRTPAGTASFAAWVTECCGYRPR